MKFICPKCNQEYDLEPNDLGYVCDGGCRVMLVEADAPKDPNHGTLRVDYRIIEGRFVAISIESNTPNRLLSAKVISKGTVQYWIQFAPNELRRQTFGHAQLVLDEGADMTVSLKLMDGPQEGGAE